MSPNVYLCIVPSIRIAYCFVRIAIRIVSVFFRIDPALIATECRRGKIFFAILARRLTSFLTANKYINTSVQKGGVPGFSGCVEHTNAITQLIREAKAGKKDLTVVWLDLETTILCR